MKRIKILALTLASSVMLMGAGYAAWTDQFTSINTIDTGKLEVLLQPCRSYAYTEVYEKYKEGEFAWRDSDESYDNIVVAEPDIDQKAKRATFQFENLFPGTKSVAFFKAKNGGTVPAAIQNVKVTVETTSDIDEKHDLEDAIVVRYYFNIKNRKGKKVRNISGESSLKDLQATLNKDLKGESLQPDCELTTFNESGKIDEKFQFYIPQNSLKGDEGEEEEVKVIMDFDFVQGNLYDAEK